MIRERSAYIIPPNSRWNSRAGGNCRPQYAPIPRIYFRKAGRTAGIVERLEFARESTKNRVAAGRAGTGAQFPAPSVISRVFARSPTKAPIPPRFPANFRPIDVRDNEIPRIILARPPRAREANSAAVSYLRARRLSATDPRH